MTSTCLVSCWSSNKSVFLAVNANRKKCEQIPKPSQTRSSTIDNKLLITECLLVWLTWEMINITLCFMLQK